MVVHSPATPLAWWMPVVLFFLLSCCRTVAYQTIDDELHTIRSQYGGVALAGLTLDSQGTVCAAGVDGERIARSGQAIQDPLHTRWQIGSCTKSMTAVLVALLLEDGTFGEGITWNSTLADILPGASLANPDSPYNLVTLQQLLSMASGLPRDADDWEKYSRDHQTLLEQRHAAAEDALGARPVYPPGTKFLYSNWGYVLMGAILEAYTGELWEELIASRIFAPLGIDLDVAQDFGVPRGDDDPWGHVKGMLGRYRSCDPSSKRTCGYLPVIGPCGGFTGKSQAMVAYLAWHMRCHNGMAKETDPQLSQATCQKLHTPVDTSLSSYALGWGCNKIDWKFSNGTSTEVLLCSHEGSIGYWIYNMWIVPTLNRAFISTTNSRQNTFRGRMTEEYTTQNSNIMMGYANYTCETDTAGYPAVGTALDES